MADPKDAMIASLRAEIASLRAPPMVQTLRGSLQAAPHNRSRYYVKDTMRPTKKGLMFRMPGIEVHTQQHWPHLPVYNTGLPQHLQRTTAAAQTWPPPHAAGENTVRLRRRSHGQGLPSHFHHSYNNYQLPGQGTTTSQA